MEAEQGRDLVFCRRKHLNLPICAVYSSPARSKAGMTFEGTQYTSGETLGGQELVSDFNVCSGSFDLGSL